MPRKEAIINLKNVLIKRRDALRQALAGDLSLLKELRDQSSGDVIDAALDAAQDEICSKLAEVESRELANIDKALIRMKDGKYGSCEQCETKIPMPRLSALPYATLCIECQRELEEFGEAAFEEKNWERLLDANNGGDDISINDIEIDVS